MIFNEQNQTRKVVSYFTISVLNEGDSYAAPSQIFMHRFHRVLSEYSGSRVLAETLDPLVRKVLLITTVGFRFGRASRSFEEHKEIIRALRNRDLNLSMSRMKTHLRTALIFNLDAWERR